MKTVDQLTEGEAKAILSEILQICADDDNDTYSSPSDALEDVHRVIIDARIVYDGG